MDEDRSHCGEGPLASWPRELCDGMGCLGIGGLSEGGSSRPGSDTHQRGRMGVLDSP